MKRNDIMKKIAPISKKDKADKQGFARFDAMTEEEQLDAAKSDPDAQPLTPEREKKMKRTPQVKIIRRALGLTQEAFSQKFHIPLGTLRDWEQARKTPDAAAKAYLVVIAKRPNVVSDALTNTPQPL